METSPTRIILVDDHQVVRDGLATLLSREADIEIVGQAANGQEAMRLLEIFDEVELILLDVDMPNMNGIELVDQLQISPHHCHVIMLTMHEERSLMEELKSKGVSGYLLKTAGREELLFAIRKVIGGGKYFSDELKDEQAPITATASDSRLHLLSSRELEVVKRIAEGSPTKEIAHRLSISPRTVDTHRNNLMKKLNIHNVAGLVRFAFQEGLVD